MSRLGLDWCRNLKPGEEKNCNFVKLSRLLWPAFCESKAGINFHNLRTKRRARGLFKTQQLPAGEGTVCLAVPRSVPFGWGYFWRRGQNPCSKGSHRPESGAGGGCTRLPTWASPVPVLPWAIWERLMRKRAHEPQPPALSWCFWAKMCLAQGAGL